MKVHFACTTSELAKYKNNYRKICALIKQMGHTIVRDWIEEAIDIVENKKLASLNRQDVYNKVTAAIFSADVMVIEGTVSSFSVGNQLTIGLSKNKPTLYLVAKKTKGNKSETENPFLNGLNSPLLKVVEYDDLYLEKILHDFFDSSLDTSAIKFNIVLSKETKSYLDWISFVRKINRSEFIRDLILKHLKEDDKEYQKFLKAEKK